MFVNFFDTIICGTSADAILESCRAHRPGLPLSLVPRTSWDESDLYSMRGAKFSGVVISDGEQFHAVWGTAQRRIHDDGRVECGDVMYHRADGTPSRRLCGGCSALTDDGMARPDGCGDVLERDDRAERQPPPLTGIPDLDAALLAAAREHGTDIGRDEALDRDRAADLTAESACDSIVAEFGGAIAESYAIAGMDPEIAWEATRAVWREAFVAAYDAVIRQPATTEVT